MKWALGGVTLIAVIAITAAVSIALTKGGGGGGNGTPSASASPSTSASGTASNSGGEIASANDTGPVNIITSDPTCSAFWPINNNYVAIQKKGGWVDRDPSIAASSWPPELRSQYEEVGKSMRATADQFVPLLKSTPHRIMRELYQQFIVFARAFSDSIPNYTAADNDLAGVAFAASTTVADICSAIDKGSAEGRALSLQQPTPPSSFAEVGDPANPVSFMKTADSTCGEWERLLTQFVTDPTVVQWGRIDPNIPASGLPSDQRAINDAVAPIMTKFADDLENLGRSSSNPTIQDLAVLSAQYRRAYVASLPSYTSADSWLDGTAGRSANMVLRACKAAGG